MTSDEIEQLAAVLAPMVVEQLESRVILWIEFGSIQPRPEDRERQCAPWLVKEFMDPTRSPTDIESKSIDEMERSVENLLENLRQPSRPNDSNGRLNAKSSTTRNRPHFGPKRKNCGDSPTSTTQKQIAETGNS